MCTRVELFIINLTNKLKALAILEKRHYAIKRCYIVGKDLTNMTSKMEGLPGLKTTALQKN